MSDGTLVRFIEQCRDFCVSSRLPGFILVYYVLGMVSQVIRQIKSTQITTILLVIKASWNWLDHRLVPLFNIYNGLPRTITLSAVAGNRVYTCIVMGISTLC